MSRLIGPQQWTLSELEARQAVDTTVYDRLKAIVEDGITRHPYRRRRFRLHLFGPALLGPGIGRGIIMAAIVEGINLIVRIK